MLNLLAALVIAAGPVRIVDGDTLDINNVRIRILGIDTPETWPGKYKCESELKLGRKAAARLQELILSGTVTYEGNKLDYYDRLLAHVYVNGINVGDILIKEGFAVKWEGHRHAWC